MKNRKYVESSTVQWLEFDPEQKVLTVCFKSGGTYHYDGVEPEAYAALENAESVGKHLHRHVKGKYAHRKGGTLG